MESEKTVFIVDDDSSVRNSLSALVAADGLLSRAYDSAEQLLESGDYRSPGCIVTDVRMGGMTGHELCVQVRREGVDIPIIMITGFADSPDAEAAVKSATKGVRVLEKTCSGDEIIKVIKEALDMS